MQVTPELRNPAGTLQGAMVALFAEAAAEELASARFDMDAVVTELDLRYLAQTAEGPVQSVCTLLGDGPDAPIQVELSDRSSGRLTTLAYARTATIPTLSQLGRSSVAHGLVDRNGPHMEAAGAGRRNGVRRCLWFRRSRDPSPSTAG